MASMNDKDYYAILGVEHDADDAAIRKAFQKLARKYHPDINKEPGAEEKFKEILRGIRRTFRPRQAPPL